MTTIHENLFLKLTGLMFDKSLNVLELGEKMEKLGSDNYTDGGYWIMDFKSNKEYYSPLFRKVIEYEGEHDFPSVTSSWKNLLSKKDLELTIENLNKYLATNGDHPYYQIVTYPKKNGGEIKVICSGTMVYNDKNKPDKMFGSHKILK